jgi:hypothetical protein
MSPSSTGAAYVLKPTALVLEEPAFSLYPIIRPYCPRAREGFYLAYLHKSRDCCVVSHGRHDGTPPLERGPRIALEGPIES